MLGSTKINNLRPVSVASVHILLVDSIRIAKSRESVAYACKISPLKAMGRIKPTISCQRGSLAVFLVGVLKIIIIVVVMVITFIIIAILIKVSK